MLLTILQLILVTLEIALTIIKNWMINAPIVDFSIKPFSLSKPL